MTNMAQVRSSSSLKRPRSPLSSSQQDDPESSETEFHSLDEEEEAQEWRETLQAEPIENGEDAEMEATMSGHMRLEDLDERLKEVLIGISSKTPKEALVTFRQFLQGDDGGKLLFQYVLLSPKCTEITSLWSSEGGAEYAVPLLQLLNELIKHPVGKVDDLQHSDPSMQMVQVVRVRIDKLAKFIISSKLKDIYTHLTSGERSRQCAALHLLASIVKRGSMLASELATSFDFTLNALSHLAKASRNSKEKKREVKRSFHIWSTRSAFVDFAMSFLEVCHAALLRWVLQIRPLYGGVLHKLASDDETTIISVLKVFQLKVLDVSAMVPPGLQSAVFGDAALEQLANISADEQRSEAAQVAHDTLLQLCTDVSHGICPEPSVLWGVSHGKAASFGGGKGRLVRLMIKLKVTEVQNHRDLLLTIAARRPMLVATYFESFPYSLEPRTTSAWFAAAALVSDIIFVSKDVPPLESLAIQRLPPPTTDSPLTQGILRSALPRTLTRLVINRGLLHVNILVKHGCLRMLSEVLSAGEFYLKSISKARSTCKQMSDSIEARSDAQMTKEERFSAFLGMETMGFDSHNPHKMDQQSTKELDACQKWLAFERSFQHELRSVLPDPQVLFSLLSLKPIDSGHSLANKRRKDPVGTENEELMDGERDDVVADQVDEEYFTIIRENGEANLVDIWNADETMIQTGDLKDVGGFLIAKLLEVLATYQRIMPMALVESSFDVFKLLPEDPITLTLSQQKGLLMVLLAALGDASGQETEAGHRSQVGYKHSHLYRHLKPILKLLLGSKVEWIKQKAQFLAYRAMVSCGAFESNSSEVGIWLQFLSLFDNWVLSFFCDAVETVGRSVDKYLVTLLSIIHAASAQELTFAVPQFGPLVVCILDKCLRVLASNSKNLKISQRTSVSVYVANALGLLVQTQVYPQILSTVLEALLSSKLDEMSADKCNFRSEWSPLQSLLFYIRWHLRRKERPHMGSRLLIHQTGCVKKALIACKVDMMSSLEEKALALSSCLQCAPPEELAENFPTLMELFFSLFKGKVPVLVGLFGAYRWLLSDITRLWPELFKQALLSASVLVHSKRGMEEKSSSSEGQNLLPPINDILESERNFDITSFSFSVLLVGLPFSVIFPAAASINKAEVWESPHLRSILQLALSEVSPQLWLCTANSVLYWVEYFWELHCKKGLSVKCQLEVCFCLLKSMILPSERCGWFSLLESGECASSELDLIAGFLRGVLTHPIMNLQLQVDEVSSDAAPADCYKENMGFDETQVLEQWFQKGGCEISLLQSHTVVIVKELLQWASELPNKKSVKAFENDCQSLQRDVLLSCKPFLREISYAVKRDVARQKRQYAVLPSMAFYLAFTFSCHMNVEEVVELSSSLLSEEQSNAEVLDGGPSSLSIASHVVGLYFATSAFKRIISLLSHQSLQCSYQRMLQNLYQKVLDIVLTKPSEMAFSCLLSALEAHRSCNHLGWKDTSSTAVPLNYINTTPSKLIANLMTGMNNTKAEILLYLIQSNQCYLAEFADTLSCKLGVKTVPLVRLAPLVSGSLLPHPCCATANYALKDLLLLLPSVNWLVNVTHYQDHMVQSQMVLEILTAYHLAIPGILKDLDILVTDLDTAEVFPFLEAEHYDHFTRYFGSTTAGQVVLMLKHCLAHHHFTSAEKKTFFSFMIEKSYPLFDSSVRNMDEISLKATLKLATIITAKSMLTELLLAPNIHEANGGNSPYVTKNSNVLGEVADMETEQVNSNLLEVIDVFICTLSVLFKQKTSESTQDKDDIVEVSDTQVHSAKHKLLQLIERMLLKDLLKIFKATGNVQHGARHLSFLKRFTKMVLKFRFGESLPMQVLGLYASKMVQVPDLLQQYCAYAMNLLIGHSQFASTLLSSDAHARSKTVFDSYIGNEGNLKSLSSILSLLKTPIKMLPMSKFIMEAESKDVRGPKLELVRFMRLLNYFKQQATALGVSMEQNVDASELFTLLLAAYGASLSETDKEILLLMREMEYFEGKSFFGLAGMDYLWGEAALKWRQENMNADYNAGACRDEDTSREIRKRCFKEELPLDLIRCALGVLFFPSRRNLSRTSALLMESYEEEEKKLITESNERLLQDSAYDPCFILPFALHSLSSGWIDAKEFVHKGLLALALSSTASAEEDMRKLGYEVLSRFFKVLEESPSFKGKPQIRLLLIFVKNSVLEPWQQLPSVAALFAAEASCILMTPSDVHYPAVNKFLFRSSCLDLETIPLFKPMFGSGSVYFRKDRSWILRLLAFSLRTSFDTHVYRRRFVMEILMSFYSSPMGDRHSREWILQILFRASKLRSFAQYLVEHCGLLSWLTTIVCSNGTARSGEYLGGISTELAFEALQIFENTLHWRSVKRWLISEGFEELSKMALVLHYALVESKSFSDPSVFMEFYLRILRTAFLLTQARRKTQSQFHLSLGGFVAILECIERERAYTLQMRMLALETIVESEPPACCLIEERSWLLKVGMWSFSMGLKALKLLPYFLVNVGNANIKENFSSINDPKALIAAIFGWLNASLILGESHKVNLQGPATAWTFLRELTRAENYSSASQSDICKDLLKLLFHLQSFLGTAVTNASAVCAVLLLLSSIQGPCGTFIKDFQDFLEWPLRQLPFPVELDASWRWRPFQKPLMQSVFQSETCQILFALFQKLLYIKDDSELQGMVDMLGLGLRNFLERHQSCHSADEVLTDFELWKHLNKHFELPEDVVLRTSKCEIQS